MATACVARPSWHRDSLAGARGQRRVQMLTAHEDVAQLHAHALVQREAPGRLVLVAGVAAVGVAAVELLVAHRQVGVAVRVLGVPWLALPA